MLFVDTARELNRMKFKVFAVLAICTLQPVQALIQGKPSSFMDAESHEDVMVGIDIRQIRRTRGIEVEEIYKMIMEAQEGVLSPSVPRALPGHIIPYYVNIDMPHLHVNRVLSFCR